MTVARPLALWHVNRPLRAVKSPEWFNGSLSKSRLFKPNSADSQAFKSSGPPAHELCTPTGRIAAFNGNARCFKRARARSISKVARNLPFGANFFWGFRDGSQFYFGS